MALQPLMVQSNTKQEPRLGSNDMSRFLGMAILIGIAAGVAVTVIGRAFGWSGPIVGGVAGGIAGGIIAGLWRRKKQ